MKKFLKPYKVIIVSGGRTGTKYFGDLLGTLISDALSVHEPDVWKGFHRGSLERIKTFGIYHMIFGRLSGKTGIRNLSQKYLAKQINLEELVEHQWYDVRTFSKKLRRTLQTPDYLLDLLASQTVTAVEMHSHTTRSDGLIEPERIISWTDALRKKGYFCHEHLSIPLVVVITDHDYIYEHSDLKGISDSDALRFLTGTEVSTEHGHVLYYGSHPEIIYTYELDRPQLTVLEFLLRQQLIRNAQM